jgi:hypothetical protein
MWTRNAPTAFSFLLSAGLAAAKHDGRRQCEIKIESPRVNFHSGNTKPQHANKVKNYGKTISTKSSNANAAQNYIKRKTARARAKKPAPKKAA